MVYLTEEEIRILIPALNTKIRSLIGTIAQYHHYGQNKTKEQKEEIEKLEARKIYYRKMIYKFQISLNRID